MEIALPSDADLSAEALAALQTVPPLNVFRMVARAEASLQPFIDLARSILVGAELDARIREVAVLRVAHVARSGYVLGQHLVLAHAVGVSEPEIAAALADGATVLDGAAGVACRVADEITREGRLGDATLAEAVGQFGERQATELILSCSYFNMVCRFLESTRVPLDLVGAPRSPKGGRS